MMVDNPSMKTPGELVSEAREARVMSLAELSERTKIPPPILTAIELDEYHKISGPLYIKSFLRSCADVLDLDSEHLIRLYSQYSGEVKSGTGQDETIWEEEVQIQHLGMPWHRILPIGGLVLVVIGAVAILGRTGCQDNGDSGQPENPRAMQEQVKDRDQTQPTVGDRQDRESDQVGQVEQVQEGAAAAGSLPADIDAAAETVDPKRAPQPQSPHDYGLDTLAGGYMAEPVRVLAEPAEEAGEDKAEDTRTIQETAVASTMNKSSKEPPPGTVEQAAPDVAPGVDGDFPPAPPGLPALEFEGGERWPLVLRIVSDHPVGIHVRQDGTARFAPAIWPTAGSGGTPLPDAGIRMGRAYRVREGWVVYWGARDHFELRLDGSASPVDVRATLNGKPKKVRHLRPGQVMLLDAY